MIVTLRLLVLACIALSTTGGAADDDVAASGDTLAIPGEIREVTVYRTQALVTREITFANNPGLRSIRVVDLPETLIADSVFAEGLDGTTIHAVRLSSRQTDQSTRSDVRKLQQQIDELAHERKSLQAHAEAVEYAVDSLDKMNTFTAEKANQDANGGTLQPEALITWVEFTAKSIEAAMEKNLRIQREQAEVTRRIEVLSAQRDQLTGQSRGVDHVATVFFGSSDQDNGRLRLSYRVDRCGWTPQYTVHGKRQSDQFQLRYGALVTQTTGEPWDDVRLVLSTASATLDSAGPALVPFPVKTVPTPAAGRGTNATAPADQTRLKSQVQNIKQLQNRAETELQEIAPRASRRQRDATLNSLGGELQRLELLAAAETTRSLAPDAFEEVTTQTYQIEKKISLDSRRDQQLVQIFDASLNGKMYHVATPLLSSYAYRETELQNSQPIGLMAGVASVYLDGRFVGETTVPPTASGQRLVIGFGADQQIRTRRELLRKAEDVRGGNRIQKLSYRLVIANFKDEPVRVRVFDRMPIVKETQSISISSPQSERPTSVDPLYLRVRRPSGILRWDVDVPAESFGGGALDLDYHYELEFDRSRQLALMSTQASAGNTIDAFGIPDSEVRMGNDAPFGSDDPFGGAPQTDIFGGDE